jgi:hypothetical protein
MKLFALLITAAGLLLAADADQAAADYCTKTGGLVETRTAVWNTNGPPSSWLVLTGVRRFCQYTSSTDGSRIHILLSTLYSTKPTLAALAYYGKPAMSGGGPGNPASYYCTQLGGSDQFGGTTPAGGGWVMMGAIDEVLEACIFPDMSSIDSWGLTYNSANIVRGIDLSTVMRFKNPNPAK